MKLTMKQLNELTNRHIGSGVLLVSLGNNTVRMIDVYLGQANVWYCSGQRLDTKLEELAKELKLNRENEEDEDYLPSLPTTSRWTYLAS